MMPRLLRTEGAHKGMRLSWAKRARRHDALMKPAAYHKPPAAPTQQPRHLSATSLATPTALRSAHGRAVGHKHRERTPAAQRSDPSEPVWLQPFPFHQFQWRRDGCRNSGRTKRHRQGQSMIVTFCCRCFHCCGRGETMLRLFASWSLMKLVQRKPLARYWTRARKQWHRLERWVLWKATGRFLRPRLRNQHSQPDTSVTETRPQSSWQEKQTVSSL